MIKYIFSLFAFICFSVFAGEVKVTSVTAQQRYPWNGLVDITVTLQGTVDDIAEAEWSFAATNSATKAAISVDHITQNGVDTGSGTTWIRKFIWDAKADVGAVKIEDVALTVDAKDFGGVQLWENGPYWAECNVGAEKPEEYGYYFWWGDTVGYKRNASDDGWGSVKDGTSFLFEDVNCPTYGKSNLQLQSAGYIDATGNLVAAHDAATAHLGAPWRMPTIEEFNTLIRKCTTIWTTRNGVRGMLVIGEGAYASKSIFLPVAGYGEGSGCDFYGTPGRYWSSTPDSDDYPNDALSLCIDIDVYYVGGAIIHCSSMSGRYLGQSLRPVRGFAK